MALGMRFQPFLEPSTKALGLENPQVELEIFPLHDGARAFDRPLPMPYVERNFRGYSVPLNP